jgi:hypothetical protein
MDYFLYISTKTTSIAPTVRFCSDCDTRVSYPFSGSIPQDFSEKYPNILSWVGLLFVSVQSNHRNSLFRYKSETTKQTVPKKAKKKEKKTKKNEKIRKNPKFSVKNGKICSLSNCFGWSSVCFGSIETSKLSVSVLKRNNRNKRFVSDSAETSFGSSFGCFESKLFSKDTLVGCPRNKQKYFSV